MIIQSGGATGGSPSGQDIHSDAIDITKTPQANGGMPTKVTSYYQTPQMSQDGERGVGNMSKDMFGSMNGQQAGEMKNNGGV